MSNQNAGKSQFVKWWPICIVAFLVIWLLAVTTNPDESSYKKIQTALLVATFISLLLILLARNYIPTAIRNVTRFRSLDLSFRFDILILSSLVMAIIGLISIDYSHVGKFQLGTVVVLALINIINLLRVRH